MPHAGQIGARRHSRRGRVGAVSALGAFLVIAGCGLTAGAPPTEHVRLVTSTVPAVAAVSVVPGANRRWQGDSLRIGGLLDARFVTYLQFRLRASAGSLTSSWLRLMVETSTSGGFLVAGTAPVKGVSGPLKVGRLPALAYALGSSGPTVKGASITVPLRGLTRGPNGVTTVALLSASGADIVFEGTSGQNRPQLTVTHQIGGSSPTPPTPKPQSVQIAAAGDIACDAAKPAPSGPDVVPGIACGQQQTSNLLLQLHPDAVLPLGDTQYSNGALEKYAASYGPSWGRLLAVSHPATGNHEYLNSVESTAGAGYFAYFGAAAGAVGQGWYSFDLGGWHLISLNAQCAAVGGCQRGSVQERWLAADLKAHPNKCTIAYWHQPRFSSGQHGDEAAYSAFWNDLYKAGADLVLNGHDHDYERFAPQNPAAQADPIYGIREFVVGTGGEDQRPFRAVASANSEVREDHTFGVLDLTLNADSYTWRFVPVPGSSFTDTGSGSCHGVPHP